MNRHESETPVVTLDELDLFSDPDWPPPVEREPRPCRHPKHLRRVRYVGEPVVSAFGDASVEKYCAGCGHIFDAVASRRGKNNRKRGLSLQLEHARRLGLTNLQGNGAADAKSEAVYGNAAFVAQMKSGGLYPGWMQRQLDYLPRTGGRTPILVVIETPGPGRKARALVVMDEQDWIEHHVGSQP